MAPPCPNSAPPLLIRLTHKRQGDRISNLRVVGEGLGSKES